MGTRRSKEEERALEVASPLISLLEDTISGLDAATELVGAFYEDGTNGAEKELFEHLRNFESCLKQMDEHRDCMKPLGAAAMVPLDLLDHVDRIEMCNPDIYTRHKVEFALEEKTRLKRMKDDFDTISSLLDQAVKAQDLTKTE